MGGEGERGGDEGESDRHRVAQGAEREAGAGRACRRDVDPVVEEVSGTGEMPPQGLEGERHQDHDQAVDGRRHMRGRVLAQVLREHRGRPRHRGHHHQDQQVQEHQGTVDPGDVTEQLVMVDPHDADDQETHHIRGVRGPLGAQRLPQTAVFTHLGDLDLQDEQGDGDGEHTVAEGLDPAGLVHGGQTAPWPVRARHEPRHAPRVTRNPSTVERGRGPFRGARVHARPGGGRHGPDRVHEPPVEGRPPRPEIFNCRTSQGSTALSPARRSARAAVPRPAWSGRSRPRRRSTGGCPRRSDGRSRTRR